MIDFRYSHEIAHLDQVLYRLKVQAASRGFAERAVFRDNSELLPEIAQTVVRAAADPPAPKRTAFPCVFEKSFKRVEDAAVYLSRLRALGLPAEYPPDPVLGSDAHTVRTQVRDTVELVNCI